MNSWLRVPLVRGRTCGVRQKCPGGSLISLVRAMPERGVFAPGFLRVRSAATSAVLAAPAFLRASSSPRPLLPCLRFPSPQRNPSNEVLSAPTLRPRSTPERSLPSHPRTRTGLCLQRLVHVVVATRRHAPVIVCNLFWCQRCVLIFSSLSRSCFTVFHASNLWCLPLQVAAISSDSAAAPSELRELRAPFQLAHHFSSTPTSSA
jgi:hypothetical protein